MTNREWLNSLSNEELIVAWNNKCAVCTERYTCEKGDKCAYGLKSWLEAEHIEPLELCPFKCKGCSRGVSIGFTGSLYYVRHFGDILYSKYCHLRIKGEGIAYYSKESDAVEAWNRTVRGE
jgi:hypothetical protein